MLCVFLLGFWLPTMRGKDSLLLRFGFCNPFSERTFVFVVLMPPCVFQWCFAYVFACLLGFLFPKVPGLGLVFEIHFRERTFVFVTFCCLDAALCFSVVFCLCFCILVGFSVPENAWQKFASS